MVSARQGNMKRKNMNNKGGNNMRKNFKQGQHLQQQQHGGGFKQQLLQQHNGGRPNMGAMFNQNPMMDNPNQMMDNPGYMDFNEPPIRQPYQPKGGMNNKNIQQNGNNAFGDAGISGGGAVGKINKNRGRRMGMKQQRGPGQQRGNQRNGGIVAIGNKNNNANGGGRWGGIQRNGNQGNGFGMGVGNGGQFRNGPRIPPMGPMTPMHPGDFDYAGPQFFGPPQRFAPGPQNFPGPSFPPLGMSPMGPRGHMMPRGRPIPPPIAGPNMPPFRNNGNAGGRGPIRRKPGQQSNNRRSNMKGGKNKKKGNQKGNQKGKKQLTNAEKYPLDKPWVNDEIKAAHDKKVELANQLKGKKNDELFAEFKKQRDAFVTLYEAARTEHNAKNKPEVII